MTKTTFVKLTLAYIVYYLTLVFAIPHLFVVHLLSWATGRPMAKGFWRDLWEDFMYDVSVYPHYLFAHPEAVGN